MMHLPTAGNHYNVGQHHLPRSDANISANLEHCCKQQLEHRICALWNFCFRFVFLGYLVDTLSTSQQNDRAADYKFELLHKLRTPLN